MKHKLTMIASLLFLTFTCAAHGLCQWVKADETGDETFTCMVRGGDNIFAGTDVYNPGNTGQVFLSSDNGTSWKTVSNGLPKTGVLALAVKGADLFAGNYQNGVFRSTDNGTTWQSAGLEKATVYALLASGTYLFAGTSTNSYRSSDNGANWTELSRGMTNTSVTSFALKNTTLFAATAPSGISRSDDNGTTWQQINSSLISVYCFYVSGTNLFAVGLNGLFRSSDNGANWTAANAGIPKDDYIISITAGNSKLFAATYNFDVYQSHNDGASWTPASTGIGVHDNRANVLWTTNTRLFAGTGGYSFPAGGIWSRPLSDFGTSSVKDPKQSDLNIALAPNPTTGIITVHNAPENIVHVTVRNILGENVLDLTKPNSSEFMLDLTKFSSGTYVATFATPTSIITRKIIRQ